MWGGACAAADLEQQRLDFMQVENIIVMGMGGNFPDLARGLENYPLYPYLEYQWLSRHLHEKDQIQTFLSQHKSSRYARRLRQQWLSYLYKQKQWKDYVAYYKHSKSRARLCQYHWSRYQLNYKTKALQATQKIWLSGASLPKACDPLLDKFSKSSFLTQKLIWQRFKLAMKARQLQLAAYLAKKMSKSGDRKNAELWIKLVKNPELIRAQKFRARVPKQQRTDMFLYAMKRLISRDVEQALSFWKGKKSAYQLSQAQINKVNRAIALQFAFNKSDKAYAFFTRLNTLDATTREWAVRAALIENNWQHVQSALDNLSAAEKQEQRWQYWQARTFFQTSQQSRGKAIYSELAKERSYYGFIAADYLQQAYLLENKPIQIDEQKSAALLATLPFQVINEFRLLQRPEDARLNWWDALRGAKGDTLLVAAKLAQHWRWHKMAILTVARAKNWDDVSLRFPIDYADKIQENAQLQEMDQAIIYGLVRRESMFDEMARSPVGAMGLMQIMPRTGREIAKDLKFPWRSKKVLFEAPLNIKFGAYYYKKMLERFSGHFALAAAAYNAGPDRVSRWLKIDDVYAADVWIETIPYKETRAYVSAVLTYALIYQNRLGEGELTMTDFMREISPEKLIEADLLIEKI